MYLRTELLMVKGIVFDPEKETEITRQIRKLLVHPPTQDDIIHVVWYVIDSTGARFTPFESKYVLQS
jgi:hypothetical protein